MPPPLPSRKFPWVIYLIILGVILAIALAPVGSVILSSWIANAHGCQLDEGGTHPCVIGGTDYGTTLNTMFVLGWLMLLTLPVGALGALVWVLVLVIHRARWRRQGRNTEPPETRA